MSSFRTTDLSCLFNYVIQQHPCSRFHGRCLKVWDCRLLGMHRGRKASAPVEHTTPSLGWNQRAYGKFGSEVVGVFEATGAVYASWLSRQTEMQGISIQELSTGP